MLTVLTGTDLGDACVVVTRYFGGTKLGTGGLVKAYTEATQVMIPNPAPQGTITPILRIGQSALNT